MGYYYGMGACYCCRRPFTFNVHLVPSIKIDGVRQPLCRDCIERANPKRIANGLEPVVPHPDAYEPEEEGQW